MLQSTSTGKFYVGQCENIEARLLRHNSNMVPSTNYKWPWKVVYTENYENRSMAVGREMELKKKKSRIYIENLIRNWQTRPD
nr:GIY-YIG nuclease family protein [Bacteroidota bacterium]MBK9650250.1 GIY-YIG nuclease family protein [Bacteroidota bacterium]